MLQIRKYLKIIYRSHIGRKIRDYTGFRSPIFLFHHKNNFISSDLFIWRTDQEIQTVFKASNILKKYYDIESFLTFIFYDRNGKFLMQKNIQFKNLAEELIIDKKLIGFKSYGTFNVFNRPIVKLKKKFNVTNRCYVGYGRNGEFSMVHGNIIGSMINEPFISENRIIDHIKPAITNRKVNFKYFIQKKISKDYNTTFGFTNPLDRRITIEINNSYKINIEPKGCNLLYIRKEDIKKQNIITSDFVFARPILFCENHQFIDCHHG